MLNHATRPVVRENASLNGAHEGDAEERSRDHDAVGEGEDEAVARDKGRKGA